MLDLEGQMRLGSGARRLLHELAASGGQLEELRLRDVFRNFTDGSDDWNAGFVGETLVPLKTLRSLVLDDASFKAEHIAALAAAWFWPQLKQLSLIRCNLGPGALDPLAVAAPGLRELRLEGNNRLGCESLRALAGYPLASTLERIGLKGTARAGDLEGLPASFLQAVDAGGGVAA